MQEGRFSKLTTKSLFQYRISVWQTLEQSILMRTSDGPGASTWISSIFSASPAPQHTAAAFIQSSLNQQVNDWIHINFSSLALSFLALLVDQSMHYIPLQVITCEFLLGIVSRRRDPTSLELIAGVESCRRWRRPLGVYGLIYSSLFQVFLSFFLFFLFLW